MAANEVPMSTIAPVETPHNVLGLGCWTFGGDAWGGQDDADSLPAMQAAFEAGLTHFDTADSYGKGRSEELVGKAIHGFRDKIFLATKGFPPFREPERVTGAVFKEKVDASLKRLNTDWIDLYYIHWPVEGLDMRPVMEGLEEYRAQGKIKAIGVSNFSVEQMEQVSEVGQINAHQFCYNLFWRYPERDVIPYCIEKNIAVVSYSSIAQGILTGKFGREVSFPQGDHRKTMVMFLPEVWPHVYEGVEELKALSAEAQRPLLDLAIRWVARQAGMTTVLVGVRNTEQVRKNAAAMVGQIDERVFDRMTEISERVMAKIPDTGNIFRFYPGRAKPY